jgi:hypothetical protein
MPYQRPVEMALEPAMATPRRPERDGLTGRRRYRPPHLVALGDLRDVTLGGSVGRADSGAPTRQARVGGP